MTHVESVNPVGPGDYSGLRNELGQRMPSFGDVAIKVVENFGDTIRSSALRQALQSSSLIGSAIVFRVKGDFRVYNLPEMIRGESGNYLVIPEREDARFGIDIPPAFTFNGKEDLSFLEALMDGQASDFIARARRKTLSISRFSLDDKHGLFVPTLSVLNGGYMIKIGLAPFDSGRHYTIARN